MRIEVSHPVLTETTECRYKFACLSSAPGKMCKARGLLDKEILIIDCAGDCLCRYRLSFGNWSTCSCPTRKEIYHRYAV